MARATSFSQQEEMRNIERLWKSKQWKHFFVNFAFGYISQCEESWSPDLVSWSQSRARCRALAQHRAGTSPGSQSCCVAWLCMEGVPSLLSWLGKLVCPSGEVEEGKGYSCLLLQWKCQTDCEVHLNSKVGSGSQISKW